jgi:FkbM family methyltransferase
LNVTETIVKLARPDGRRLGRRRTRMARAARAESAAAVFARSYSPPIVYSASAHAPPYSEVGAPPGAVNYSWVRWWSVRNGPCVTFAVANPCGIEGDMWTMVRALLDPNLAVLELGARYGTTSCVLAAQTRNSGRVVSVEPDPRAHVVLQENLHRHSCSVGVFRGTIGHTTQVIAENPRQPNQTYELRTRPFSTASDSLARRLDRLTASELERFTGLRFGSLVVDCEGCLDDAFADDWLTRRSAVELIILELDAPRRISYTKWHAKLEDHGFQRIWRLEDAMYGGSGTGHVAYHRSLRSAGGAERALPSCREYANRQPGWRCVSRVDTVRPGFRNPRYTCGSRLTCLSPGVVNGSREAAELKVLRANQKKG